MTLVKESLYGLSGRKRPIQVKLQLEIALIGYREIKKVR